MLSGRALPETRRGRPGPIHEAAQPLHKKPRIALPYLAARFDAFHLTKYFTKLPSVANYLFY